MKLNYYGYCLVNLSDSTKKLVNLKDFLGSYCQSNNVSLKNQFKHQDENLYLMHVSGDVFLFIITRSNELIKKVNTNDLSVGEIHSMLSRDEQLGFASYLIVRDGYFGFASTLLAPRFDVFSDYINKMLVIAGITNWQLVVTPLLHQATREEALSMEHIGRTSIQLSKESSFAQTMLAVVTAEDNDTFDLDGIEVTLRPKSRRNIKPTVEKFLNSIPDDGLQKMTMKAKAQVGSLSMDIYLAGKGAVFDIIDKSNEARIPRIIESKCSENEFLSQKVREYKENEKFDETPLGSIVQFSNTDSWSGIVLDIQQTSSV